VPQRTETTREQLREIVMAQEFQDLTGQVLKRITDIANHLETQLLTLLVENSPVTIRRTEALGLLNGPAVNGSVADVVANQAQVDELLESLGF
jgi:chemotaxis protein CheZ